jgi:hypothetical protein
MTAHPERAAMRTRRHPAAQAGTHRRAPTDTRTGWLAGLLAGLALGCASLAVASDPVNAPVNAQSADLNLKLACQTSLGEQDQQTLYIDSGEIRIEHGKLLALRWESALHRRTHGFDCSIDLDDKLQLDAVPGGWRIQTDDPQAARQARGYDAPNGSGSHCLINLEQADGQLTIAPSCPALCGSRSNFSGLQIDLKSGRCTYTTGLK